MAGFQINFYVLMFATSAVGNLLVGCNLAGFNQSAEVVSAQLGWKGDANIAIANDCAVLGLMFGSLFAGKIMEIGRKRTAMLANIIGIVGCLPQLILSIYGFAIGKLIMGFGGGLMIVTCSVYIAESLPSK